VIISAVCVKYVTDMKFFLGIKWNTFDKERVVLQLFEYIMMSVVQVLVGRNDTSTSDLTPHWYSKNERSGPVQVS
jgi:hypothetical protein